MELLTSFNHDQGLTVVMVTHDAVMASYAKRMIHFRDGFIEKEESNRGR